MSYAICLYPDVEMELNDLAQTSEKSDEVFAELYRGQIPFWEEDPSFHWESSQVYLVHQAL